MVSSECKSFEKSIPGFLSDSLDNRSLEQFLDHLAGCKNCQDELSVQFLVAEGMNKLETGENFHLQRELRSLIELQRKRASFRRRLTLIAYTLEGAGILAALALVIAGFVNGLL